MSSENRIKKISGWCKKHPLQIYIYTDQQMLLIFFLLYCKTFIRKTCEQGYCCNENFKVPAEPTNFRCDLRPQSYGGWCLSYYFT